MPHAILSPSGAAKWMSCAGSAAMEDGLPNPSSKYSDQGTAAHFLASEWLTTPAATSRDFLDRTICVYEDEVCWDRSDPKPGFTEWSVDEEMLYHIQRYIDNIKQYQTGGRLFVEQRLPIDSLTGEDGAEGTADAVILRDDELQVHDLKYGMGIEVQAERNSQLMIYALAAYKKYNHVAALPIQKIRLVIHQPRKNHFPEWSCTLGELLEFEDEVVLKSSIAWNIIQVKKRTGDVNIVHLSPGLHCKNGFCRARAECPAIAGSIVAATADGFENLDEGDALTLTDKMQMIPMVEDWCKAVRAKVESELFLGHDVPGYKLVQGKKGNRRWTDNEIVEELMKSMRIKHEYIYDYKLVSPTSIEKYVKEEHIKPKQWEKLQEVIVQSEGVPSVAPVTDKRPALLVAEETFEDVDDILNF